MAMHNNVRLAAAAPENGLQIVATAIQALSEIFILYKGRLKFHLGAIEDDLCIVSAWIAVAASDVL